MNRVQIQRICGRRGNNYRLNNRRDVNAVDGNAACSHCAMASFMNFRALGADGNDYRVGVFTPGDCYVDLMGRVAPGVELTVGNRRSPLRWIAYGEYEVVEEGVRLRSLEDVGI